MACLAKAYCLEIKFVSQKVDKTFSDLAFVLCYGMPTFVHDTVLLNDRARQHDSTTNRDLHSITIKSTGCKFSA